MEIFVCAYHGYMLCIVTRTARRLTAAARDGERALHGTGEGRGGLAALVRVRVRVRMHDGTLISALKGRECSVVVVYSSRAHPHSIIEPFHSSLFQLVLLHRLKHP